MSNNILSQSGIKIKFPDRFYEAYDSSLDVRKYGNDNLYPQHLRDFFESSPSFSSCARRLKNFLYGEGSDSKLINGLDLSAILMDYSIFNGFSLFVQYDGLGNIVNVNYIPFETIRLCERGTNGRYTRCKYSADWSCRSTVNKKKVTRNDVTTYWLFTEDIDTRLKRMEDPEYKGGEVLYYSNTLSYPTEQVRAAINLVSSEVGLTNLLYRDVRVNFTPSLCLGIPRQSDEDTNELAENLEHLQSDESSYKILTIEYSSQEDKPEVLSLAAEDYTSKFTTMSDLIKNKIIESYNQESFVRLAEGNLGFGSDAISNIYNYYNFQLKTEREEIERTLKKLDPDFKMTLLKYPVENVQAAATE